MESKAIKIYQKGNNKIAMKMIPGHFATNHSHINCYIDMTTLKIRQNEAAAVAQKLAEEYVNSTVVDTIVCMDGCEVIGAFLAQELTGAGIMSMNSHKTIYVVTPEFNVNNQLIFKDNLQSAIRNKHILLLLASATTGKTIKKCLECIDYYGGKTVGISAIFSAADEVEGVEVKSIFKSEDIPDYKAYDYHNCPYCKANQKLDAIVNGYGYSKL